MGEVLSGFPRKPEAAKDPRFATNVARVANRKETDALVADAFGALDKGEAEELLVRADVAFASVNDMAALSAHPHLRRISVDTPAGPVLYPWPPRSSWSSKALRRGGAFAWKP